MTREKVEELRLNAKALREKAVELIKGNDCNAAIQTIMEFDRARHEFRNAQQELIKIDEEYAKEYFGG